MLKMPRVDFGISTCRVAKVYTWTFAFPRVAFKNVILSYGILKAAQIVALKSMTGMTLQMATATVAGKALTATFVKLGASMKALALNPWTYMFAAFFAITDIIGQLRANIQAIRELNSEIREDAQEAAENTNKFLTNKGNASTRELAKENKANEKRIKKLEKEEKDKTKKLEKAEAKAEKAAAKAAKKIKITGNQI